jgi:hypothetical protein
VAYYRAAIGFYMDSLMPRDVVTINPHYSGDNAQALADALKSALIANPQVAATSPFRVKIYDAEKTPPSYPLAEAIEGTGFKTTSVAREVAMCLSYYATWNRPSFRGRLYIPAAFCGGSLGLRPTATQITNALSFFDTLKMPLPGVYMGVWSRKNRSFAQATHAWVDDEWDTVRSRGLRGTTRQLDAA